MATVGVSSCAVTLKHDHFIVELRVQYNCSVMDNIYLNVSSPEPLMRWLPCNCRHHTPPLCPWRVRTNSPVKASHTWCRVPDSIVQHYTITQCTTSPHAIQFNKYAYIFIHPLQNQIYHTSLRNFSDTLIGYINESKCINCLVWLHVESHTLD